jgi:hypothetical protein
LSHILFLQIYKTLILHLSLQQCYGLIIFLILVVDSEVFSIVTLSDPDDTLLFGDEALNSDGVKFAFGADVEIGIFNVGIADFAISDSTPRWLAVPLLFKVVFKVLW